jgi:hypothetical protein
VSSGRFKNLLTEQPLNNNGIIDIDIKAVFLIHLYDDRKTKNRQKLFSAPCVINNVPFSYGTH